MDTKSNLVLTPLLSHPLLGSSFLGSGTLGRIVFPWQWNTVICGGSLDVSPVFLGVAHSDNSLFSFMYVVVTSPLSEDGVDEDRDRPHQVS